MLNNTVLNSILLQPKANMSTQVKTDRTSQSLHVQDSNSRITCAFAAPNNMNLSHDIARKSNDL